MAKMSKAEIAASLEGLGGWKLEGKTIAKGYEFPSFSDAMRFVNNVAGLAEAADHHPADQLSKGDFDSLHSRRRRVDQEGL
jgi:4a-hydroxytetrahydrobiopterin dehydratase